MDTKETGAQRLGPWEIDSTETALQTSRQNGAAVPSMGRLLERRRDARYPTNDLAEIRILPDDSPRRKVTVLDVSRSGMKLELSTQLWTDAQVEVILPHQMVIFGEVRYCRRVDGIFQAGVLIHDVIDQRPTPPGHLRDDEVSLYLAGTGLTVPEVIRIKEHLPTCEACSVRLRQA
ncbi:MAG: PilZ domain-containing protein [Bryobacteraceae bacterium]|jgi:hypothetical protein